MRIDKKKLDNIAVDLSPEQRSKMENRKRDRSWKKASAAIAAKIRRHLKTNGISQNELAEKLGITPANITRYLNGEANFQLSTIVDIEKALSISILDRDIIPRPEPPAPIVNVLKISFSSDSDGMEFAENNSITDIYYA